ncbi:type 2 periplasmic-binding domain-containing protein [Pseudomonas taeanensis]|uniref:hypothetical protein n=1 Tax=Pseudomonas taeanensis TaxID=574962 RepID=UPI0004B1DFDC|nr:hypothetical protein [Pseudomonas taeanensis]
MKLHLNSHHKQPLENLVRGDVDLVIIPEQHVSPDNPREKLYEESCDCLVWGGSEKI